MPDVNFHKDIKLLDESLNDNNVFIAKLSWNHSNVRKAKKFDQVVQGISKRYTTCQYAQQQYDKAMAEKETFSKVGVNVRFKHDPNQILDFLQQENKYLAKNLTQVRNSTALMFIANIKDRLVDNDAQSTAIQEFLDCQVKNIRENKLDVNSYKFIDQLSRESGVYKDLNISDAYTNALTDERYFCKQEHQEVKPESRIENTAQTQSTEPSSLKSRVLKVFLDAQSAFILAKDYVKHINKVSAEEVVEPETLESIQAQCQNDIDYMNDEIIEDRTHQSHTISEESLKELSEQVDPAEIEFESRINYPN